MKWIKKGLIIKPGMRRWMVTHAQNPFTEKIDTHLYKIHFAGRDAQNMARGGYVIIDMRWPKKIISLSHKPTIDLGKLGCFDDCGVMPSCIVNFNSEKYMYYTGWTQHRKTPFSFFIGLAISKDGGQTYERYSQAPVLGRNYYDPYLTCSPYVIRESGRWKMWYVSGTGWRGFYTLAKVKGAKRKQKHYYNIKYAESSDGIEWKTNNTVCIDYKNKQEYAIARPIVAKENGIYTMWYCYRGGNATYKAGYAESSDGFTWTRKDNLVGIKVSKRSWDSTMICYPYVFRYSGKKYLLYNGNNYGETGCGYAIEDSDNG